MTLEMTGDLFYLYMMTTTFIFIAAAPEQYAVVIPESKNASLSG